MSDAIWMPLFDDLSDPGVVAGLAARAEAAGWDGFFVWDHIRWGDADRRVGDPWVTLAAVASATRRIRLGPMVSPLPRYRPGALVRQTVSLDLLSEGRLIVGAGLGADRFGGEYSRFGEETDARRRAAMTDEMLAVLRAAWSGAPVRHAGGAPHRRRRALPADSAPGPADPDLDRGHVGRRRAPTTGGPP
jgi:alkanesulfonate monooxygenase SsuD/methylene tetrahydromethanopterin reductase-like flavin-dependent oxidoreductase (luciferase family)